MTVPAPDPTAVRLATLDVLDRLALPLPPDNFPLVWEPGDQVALRPTAELEARAAVLNVVLAHAFGMPTATAITWLLDAGLVDRLTVPERSFVFTDVAENRAFALHSEALAALGWLLSIVPRLDPAAPGVHNAAEFFPNLAAAESYQSWRSRTLAAPRDAREAAGALDLYYCLDWSYLHAEEQQWQLPGMIDSNAIGQRRWALEWAVVFHGPFHDDPSGWEEVDLST